MRFEIVDDFEKYFDVIDVDYDSEDVFFTKWLYKLNTPELNKMNRSQYGKYGTGTDFRQKIFEIVGSNCFLPSDTLSFIYCNNFFRR